MPHRKRAAIREPAERSPSDELEQIFNRRFMADAVRWRFVVAVDQSPSADAIEKTQTIPAGVVVKVLSS
ncbi:magnesium chelatase [Anopheles sinensis]|uniref:Magnesium chelatase n=1 Tax=Anopheles sinensis TaxID=74873 RepID=A0A084WDE5_ANOSI|nr:magnesium chelatase [Anopheles sinensis]